MEHLIKVLAYRGEGEGKTETSTTNSTRCQAAADHCLPLCSPDVPERSGSPVR